MGPMGGDPGRVEQGRHCSRYRERLGNVAGSTVCLYEQVDLPGDGRELVDTARVRSNGGFALDVDPGPSRLLDVVYRYNNQVVEKERLHLESVVVPTFKVVGSRSLSNGQNVRFRGYIPGPNEDGRGISLQARAGRKWRTFKQVKAGSSGRFTAFIDSLRPRDWLSTPSERG